MAKELNSSHGPTGLKAQGNSLLVTALMGNLFLKVIELPAFRAFMVFSSSIG